MRAAVVAKREFGLLFVGRAHPVDRDAVHHPKVDVQPGGVGPLPVQRAGDSAQPRDAQQDPRGHHDEEGHLQVLRQPVDVEEKGEHRQRAH
eukprot:scaffold19247_cov135-Isochrysis_galbana.AAC.2